VKPRVWPTVLWFAGMIAVWVGERLLGAGSGRWVASALGAAAVVAALLVRLVAVSRSQGPVRKAQGYLAFAASLGVVALALYGAGLLVAGKSGSNLENLGVGIGGLWPAVVAVAATMLLFLELASATVNPEALELRRIRYSAASGAVIALSIVFAFSANYVGSEISAHWDANKHRTAKPSEATRNQLKAMEGPIEAMAFFANPNEVREEVVPYLDDLARNSDKLKVTVLDHALEPAKAKAQLVSNNGYVVFVKGSAREQIFIGTEMSSAKSRLASIDTDVRKSLLSLSRGPRIAYFVIGHGEREADNKDPSDTRSTIRNLRQMLTENRYNLKDLSVATGLAKEVPADASIVLVIGPQKPFQPEEIESLRRYLDGGGKMWVFLDADSPITLDELIGPYGLKFTQETLLNDQVFARKDYRPSDMANLIAVRFGSHASVTTLSKAGGRAAVVFLGAGRLEELPKKVVPDTKVFITVYAMPQTWADTNGNFVFDAPAEKRQAYPLVAAVEHDIKGKTPGRMIVSADADAVSDIALGFPGNLQFANDGLKWLGGDEAAAGEVAPPEDVRIQHTKKQDVAWFYGTVVGAPLLVLGIGITAARRRRRS
jgi:hypothetical protein